MRQLHIAIGIIAAVLVAAAILFAVGWLREVQDCGVSRAEGEFEPSAVLMVCAYAGNPPAQAWLGLLLWSDASSDPPAQSFPWLSKEKLEQRGRIWLERASARGNPIAQNDLGLAHLEGTYGVARDPVRARMLFEAASQAGDEIAPLNLARMYYNGEGVQRSEAQAEVMLRLSAQRGYFDGRCSLAALLERRNNLAYRSEIESLRRATVDMPQRSCGDGDLMEGLASPR